MLRGFQGLRQLAASDAGFEYQNPFGRTLVCQCGLQLSSRRGLLGIVGLVPNTRREGITVGGGLSRDLIWSVRSWLKWDCKARLLRKQGLPRTLVGCTLAPGTLVSDLLRKA